MFKIYASRRTVCVCESEMFAGFIAQDFSKRTTLPVNVIDNETGELMMIAEQGNIEYIQEGFGQF